MSAPVVKGEQADPQNGHSIQLSTINSSSDNDGEDEWHDEDRRDHCTPPIYTSERGMEWPKSPQTSGLAVSSKPGSRINSRKPDRRYSVQKPTRDMSKGRQRKQNAKAGIKLVTSFSLHPAAMPPVQLKSQAPPFPPQAGSFIDLAALEALNARCPSQSGVYWKTKKKSGFSKATNTMSSLSSSAMPSPPGYHQGKRPRGLTRRPSQNLHPVPSATDDDLSPNDRPIVIGISIATTDVNHGTVSLKTAESGSMMVLRNDERQSPMAKSPDTPAIIITHAQQSPVWSPIFKPEPRSDRQPPSKIDKACDAPRNPNVPASFLDSANPRTAAQQSYFSPDSDDTRTWGDEDDATGSRVVSSYTFFEEDESPILLGEIRTIPNASEARVERHASINTISTRRQSKGWWNYITTPFLTRSNTFANRDMESGDPPAIPSLSIAAAKVQGAGQDSKQWENQFSPLTPDTSTSIISDRWWTVDSVSCRYPEQTPVIKETRHKAQTSTSSTLPLVLSETVGFGTAAMSSTFPQILQSAREESQMMLKVSSEHSSIEEIAQSSSHASDLRPIQGNKHFVQSQFDSNGNGPSHTSPSASSIAIECPPENTNVQKIQSPSAGPPPPYSPPPPRVRYRAVLPAGQTLGMQYPASPIPLSPGLQQAISLGSAFPMSTIPLTPPAGRPINLNSGYPELRSKKTVVLAVAENYGAPPLMPTKAEAGRQRHEKDDAVAWRAGGWWRGRGCIRFWYRRSGPESRKRRRCYLALIITFVSMIVVVVTLTTTLHGKSNSIVEPAQWLNLTGFPPIILGLSTVAAPVNIRANTGCVFPATQWSCSLPKELQSSTSPKLHNQPDFFLHIQWDNSSSANATFSNVTGSSTLGARPSLSVRNPISAGQLLKRLLWKYRQIVTFVPSPSPPSMAEVSFLGNSTDGIASDNKAGEPTPFFISFLSTADSTINKRRLATRQSSDDSTSSFPNIASIIPPPSVNSDGTAAPANLLPFPTQQPIRLYDRGLSTEHYGFYTYFDRSIFLKSLERLNGTNLDDGEVPVDRDGGAEENKAAFRCTWSQTRFLVQIWTRTNNTVRLLNSTQHMASQDPSTDLNQPGSFLYPITITTDRHGGNPPRKMVYCYEMDSRAKLISGSGKLNSENRAFGGDSFNPAPSFFSNLSDPSLGGFDGGTGGCSCQWSNFQNIIHA